MDIGSELRQAREGLGLSLNDVSNRTKIRLSVLRAIEGNDFRQLPNDVFTRGFLKLYAREVGLDPAAVAGRFDALFEAEAAEGAVREPSLLGDTAAAPSVRPARVLAVVLIATLVAGYLGMTRWRGGSAAAGDAPPPPDGVPVTAPVSTSPAQASPAPASGAPSAPPANPATETGPAPVQAVPAPAATPAANLQIAIHATGPCWLAATADGRQVVFRLLNADERVTVEASTEAVLRIGSPGNLAVTINDRPIRPFERPGQPVTVRITPENYRELAP